MTGIKKPKGINDREVDHSNRCSICDHLLWTAIRKKNWDDSAGVICDRCAKLKKKGQLEICDCGRGPIITVQAETKKSRLCRDCWMGVELNPEEIAAMTIDQHGQYRGYENSPQSQAQDFDGLGRLRDVATMKRRKK